MEDKRGKEKERGKKEQGKKKTVLVLFGGCSTEYEVSLQSAGAVLTHIDRSRYEVLPIGIDRNGQCFWYQGPPQLIPGDHWRSDGYLTPVVVSPDRRLHGILAFKSSAAGKGEGENFTFSGPVTVIRKPVDLALPVLHGKNGEDGTVQGMLELSGIPVAGCGLLSSALCMDKDIAHRLVRAEGIRTPRSAVFSMTEENAVTTQKERWRTEVYRAAEKLGYPLFVKPVRSGSSFGITKVMKKEELMPAVFLALEHDGSVILEENVVGFEVGCAVLGKEELLTGDVDEIELSDGFFDYTEKYTLKTSSIHVPARISPEKTREVKKTALHIYRTLKCSGFARVDMFLTPQGEIVFNEVNTIPGMTAHSRYPGMFRSAGISFAKLTDRLLASVDREAGVWEE